MIHFTQTKDLNKRYIKWMITLSEYNFSIQYQKGIFNNKADILNQKLDLDIRNYNRSEILLYQERNILHLAILDIRSYIDPDLNRRIREA